MLKFRSKVLIRVLEKPILSKKLPTGYRMFYVIHRMFIKYGWFLFCISYKFPKDASRLQAFSVRRGRGPREEVDGGHVLTLLHTDLPKQESVCYQLPLW